MTEIFATGIQMGESPRWHEGRFWMCDWVAGEVLAFEADGVCADAEGAIWYASVPDERCVRVAEGGEVLEVVEADRGCFSCVLGGEDGRTLFITANRYSGTGASDGVVLTARVDVPARR